ncbi:SHOCT domain-containing protein [Caldalkalibacillus thermarum]|nr:SHOCT domain-containing protein [Caldalkalibacillus thermarum]
MMMWDGGMFLYMIFWLLIVGLIIYAVISLIMKAFDKRNDRSEGKGEDAALQILKERFARGEISEEEFEQKYKVLKDK